MEVMSRGLGPDPTNHNDQQKEMSFNIGMSFAPEFLEFPGFELPDGDCNDLMHSGGGELLKHMLKLIRIMFKSDRDIWGKLSSWVRNTLREPVRVFFSEPSF
jgi:hypothetical protein